MEHPKPNTVVKLNPNEVKVPPGRFRGDLGDLDALKESISKVGQIQPIIVTSNYTLVAGERRLTACRQLGIQVEAIIRDVEDMVRERIVEYTENASRKDFDWQEDVKAREFIHKLLLAKAAEEGKKWSEADTASAIGISHSMVNYDLQLAKAVEEAPDVFEKCKSKSDALKRLKKYKEDELMAEIALRKAKTNYGLKAKEFIFHGDCLKLISHIPDGKVDALISDPAYALDISAVKKFKDGPKDIYEDDPEDMLNTLLELIKLASKKLAPNSWVCMFCRVENFNTLRDAWINEGFMIDSKPAIWYRTGSSGQTLQPDYYFGSTYEVFLYGHRGETQLVTRGRSNVLTYPGVSPIEKVHDVQKPVELMEDIIERLCLPGHMILDPMCGSGTTLVAAIKRGCRCIGFELSERHYNTAVSRVADALRLKDSGAATQIGG